VLTLHADPDWRTSMRSGALIRGEALASELVTAIEHVLQGELLPTDVNARRDAHSTGVMTQEAAPLFRERSHTI
jgi:hypothetical protein